MGQARKPVRMEAGGTLGWARLARCHAPNTTSPVCSGLEAQLPGRREHRKQRVSQVKAPLPYQQGNGYTDSRNPVWSSSSGH